MSRDKQNTTTQAIRELALAADRAVQQMPPLSAQKLATERPRRGSAWRVRTRVGIAAAAALLIVVATLGIRSAGSTTEREVPAAVLALVDSLYSSEDFVAGELASFYAPQQSSSDGGEYLDQVWSTLSDSPP